VPFQSEGEDVLRRIVWLLVAFPAAAILVTLAVANRHGVRLVLDPFRPEDPALWIDLPFYIYLLAALVIGVALGGTATWMTQSRWRRTARRRAQEALRWQAEADRLARERDQAALAARQSGGVVGTGKALAVAGR
jgi:uncharacterized integral membrane protein